MSFCLSVLSKCYGCSPHQQIACGANGSIARHIDAILCFAFSHVGQGKKNGLTANDFGILRGLPKRLGK